MKKLHILLFFVLFCGAISNTYAILDVNTSFSPSSIQKTRTATHTIQIQNSTVENAINASFVYNLPENILITDTSNLSSTCGTEVQAFNKTNYGQIILTNGEIPGGTAQTPGSCTISVDVTSKVPETYKVHFLQGSLTAKRGENVEINPQTSVATLTVRPLQEIKVNIPHKSINGGEPQRMVLEFLNPNSIDITGVTIPERKIANGWLRIIENSFETTCGGSININNQKDGQYYQEVSRYSYSGGIIPANNSCTISFLVDNNVTSTQVSNDGEYTFSAGSIESNEGVSNSEENYHITTNNGIKIYDSYNNTTANIKYGENSTDIILTLLLRNYSALPYHDFDMTLGLPENIISAQRLQLKEIQENTCGGNIVSTTEDIEIRDGNIESSCTIKLLMSATHEGIYIIPQKNIIQDTIGQPPYEIGYSTKAQKITVIKLEKISIRKTYNTKNIFGALYLGKPAFITYSLKNETQGEQAKELVNVSIHDALLEKKNSYCSQIDNKCIVIIDSLTSTCNGIQSNTNKGDSIVDVSNIHLAPGESCDITVPIMANGNISTSPNTQYPEFLRKKYVDPIEIGALTYMFEGDDTRYVNQKQLDTYNVVEIYPVFNIKHYYNKPDHTLTTVVGGGGLMKAIIDIGSLGNHNKQNFHYKMYLDEGFVVAENPNIIDGCGGEITAESGNEFVEVHIPEIVNPNGETNYYDCIISFDVKVPHVPQEITKSFPLNRELQAKIGDFEPYNTVDESRIGNETNFITIRPQSLTSNKSFLTTHIKSGAAARVRVSFANTSDGNFDISEGTLTEDYSTGNLRLHTDVNPTFTSSDGEADKCREASFSIEGNRLTMKGAKIQSGATCYLEYNVTSVIGGNHFTEFNAGQFTSREGVSNNNSSSTTLTVERNINIGETFLPKTAEVGEEVDLVMEIFNAQLAPADETGTTFLNELPAGLMAQGIESNTCGGVASIVTQNGNSAIKLVGGTFPAENTCKITTKVSSDTVGEYTDTIAIGDFQTVAGKLNPSASETTLKVIQKPTIFQSVSVNKIPLNGTSNIVVSITNPNRNTDIHKVNFTNTLPAGLQLTTGSANTSGACIGTPKYTAISGSDTFTLDEIGVGAGGTCKIAYSVTGKNSGEKTNTIPSVDYEESKNSFGPSNSVTIKVLEPLTLTTNFSPESIYINNTSKLTYTITNTNDESIDLESIENILPTSPGVMKVSETPNLEITGCETNPRVLSSVDDTEIKANNTSLIIINGVVPANGTCTVSFDVKVNQAGVYTNETKKIISSGGESEKATATLTVDNIPLANLVTKKSVSNVNPKEGEEIIYTITVENRGPLDATNVTLTDILPVGVEYISDSTIQVNTGTGNTNVSTGNTDQNTTGTSESTSTGSTSETSTGTSESTSTGSTSETSTGTSTIQTGDYDKATGIWNIGNITNGETKTIAIQVKVKSGTANTNITNTTTPASTSDQVDSTTEGDNLEASIGVEYFNTDLVTKKSVNISNPRETDQIIYTISVENKGPDTATNVTLTDILPAGVEYIFDTGNGGYDASTGVWNMGDIANGEIKTLEIKGKVQPHTVGTSITNITTKAIGDTSNQIDPSDEGNILQTDITVQNTAPEITSNGGGDEVNISLLENTSLVTTLEANDLEDKDSMLHFSITGGEDANLFRIDSTTHELRYIGTFDFENPQDTDRDNIYKVEVTVHDSFDALDTQLLIISIEYISEGGTVETINIEDIPVRGDQPKTDHTNNGSNEENVNNGNTDSNKENTNSENNESTEENVKEDEKKEEKKDSNRKEETPEIFLENLPPVAIDDMVNTFQNQAVEIDVLANDYDPDGDKVYIQDIENTTYGVLVLNNGKIYFTPKKDIAGDTRIIYTITDKNGGESKGSIYIHIEENEEKIELNSAQDKPMILPNKLPETGPEYISLLLIIASLTGGIYIYKKN